MAFDFIRFKSNTLNTLNASIDYSSKGCIDAPIRSFLVFINSLPYFVSTSSCSGRLSLAVVHDSNLTRTEGNISDDKQDKDDNIDHLHDRKTYETADDHPEDAKNMINQEVENDNRRREQRDRVLGVHHKGVKWLLVRHGSLEPNEVVEVLDYYNQLSASTRKIHESSSDTANHPTNSSNQLILFKCEPCIFHVCCSSLQDAQELYQIAFQSGYRESGISISNTTKKIILAIRTTALSMELPIVRDHRLLVSREYLSLVVQQANQKLLENFARIDRLLLAVKRHYQWPSFTLLPYNGSSEVYDFYLKRWGHCGGIIRGEQVLVVGGQGVEQKDKTRVGRKVPPFSISGLTHPFTFHEVAVMESEAEKPGGIEAVHSRCEILRCGDSSQDPSFLLLSGGRKAPQVALSCLQLYEINSREASSSSLMLRWLPITEYDERGEIIPPPRWGHSFHAVATNRFVLFGGRDSRQCFDDLFVLEVQVMRDDDAKSVIDSHEKQNQLKASLRLCFTWKRIPYKLIAVEQSQGKNALTCARYFHASCALDNHEEHREVRIDERKVVEPSSWVLVHGGLSSLDHLLPLSSFLLIDVDAKVIRCVHWLTQPLNINDSRIHNLNRFAHSLVNIGGKSLILFGGVTDGVDVDVMNGACNKDLGSNGRVQVIHYGLGSDGSFKLLSLVDVYLVQNEGKPSDSHSVTCLNCRAHAFGAVVGGNWLSFMHLIVVGGGAPTLAFGDHFCNSFRLLLRNYKEGKLEGDCIECLSNNVNEDKADSNFDNRKPSGLKYNRKGKQPAVDSEGIVMSLLLCSKPFVKKVKTWLEEVNGLDKSVKIFSLDRLNEIGWSKLYNRIQTIALPTSSSSFVATQELDQLINKEMRLWTIDELAAVMAVPLLEPWIKSTVDKDSKVVELGLLMGWNVLHVVVDSSMSPNDFLIQDPVIKDKSTPSQRIIQFLSSWIEAHQLPSDSLPSEDLSCKLEVIADVLMLPDHYLRQPAWDKILSHPSESSIFWSNFLKSYYGSVSSSKSNKTLSRIGRKAWIDTGSMRQSQVELLYIDPTWSSSRDSLKLCACGSNHSKDIGWVTIHENHIAYGFDITKVMFCSGNNTERERMGLVKKSGRTGEVVVDLYAGIGYYTLPLLLRAHVDYVYACEMNLDSIYALQHNLITQGVQQRCEILEGDNQQTTIALQDIADRIVLGLLPTSRPGWKLAARLVKSSGGTLHVHENIAEDAVEEFIQQDLLPTLHLLFLECKTEKKRTMQVKVLHIQKVKSYAPRVNHYVIDLLCFPSAP